MSIAILSGACIGIVAAVAFIGLLAVLFPAHLRSDDGERM